MANNKSRILDVEETNESPSSEIYTDFNGAIDIPSGKDFGFIKNGISYADVFIPPDIIENSSIQDKNQISGKALMNYNKKRSKWGWKAIRIYNVIRSFDIEDEI